MSRLVQLFAPSRSLAFFNLLICNESRIFCFVALPLLYIPIMKNILLVDDEKQILQSLAEGLYCYGYDWNVLTAENGKQGADIVDTHDVDVVVTDLRMPTMDGYELLLYIRRTKPELPVIIMTADWMPELENRLIPLGAVQCMKKPFDLAEIVTSISSQLA